MIISPNCNVQTPISREDYYKVAAMMLRRASITMICVRTICIVQSKTITFMGVSNLLIVAKLQLKRVQLRVLNDDLLRLMI